MSKNAKVLRQIKEIINNEEEACSSKNNSVEWALSLGDEDYYEAILAVRKSGFWLTMFVDLMYSTAFIFLLILFLWAKVHNPQESMGALLAYLAAYLVVPSFGWYVSRKVTTAVRDLRVSPNTLLFIMVISFVGLLPTFIFVIPSFYIFYSFKAFSRWGDYKEWFNEIKQTKKLDKKTSGIVRSNMVDKKLYKIAQVVFLIIIAAYSIAFGWFLGDSISGEELQKVERKNNASVREVYNNGYSKGYAEAVECHDIIVREFNSSGRQTTNITDCAKKQ